MRLTEDNIDSFFTSLRNRLDGEMKEGTPIEIITQDHYPDERSIEVAGKTYPLPAIGETISIRIGFFFG